MRHWSEKYIGSNDGDCGDLIQKVLKAECKLDIRLPGNRRWRGRDSNELSNFGATYADSVNEPQDFDIVLMHILGRKRDLGAHVGIVAILTQRLWILHAIDNVGVVFSPKSDLPRAGLKVEGYYRCRA